jgi:ATP-binding cassette subfamily F protein 3
MLERMERIVPAHVDSPFEFEFAPPAKTPRPLLTVENAACGYPGHSVVTGINLSIGPLDRIALLGPNGAGKSTLTRLLAGEARDGRPPLMAGRRIPAADLAIGYFAQQQMEQLRPDCDAFWHVRNLGGPDYASGDEQRVRDHLGKFGFEGNRAFEPAARFSGGEKARLTLALLVARRPNLLLLDEPTNHLDIDMRQALNVALQGFEGGLVVVSHDRHLIKTVADTLWLVADGKLQVFDGDLDDYQQWCKVRAKAEQAELKPKAAKRAPRDPRSQLRRELEQIERRIAAIAAEQSSLPAPADEPAVGQAGSGRAGARQAGPGPSDLQRKLADRRARLTRDAATLEARWMELGTALEAAEAQAGDG